MFPGALRGHRNGTAWTHGQQLGMLMACAPLPSTGCYQDSLLCQALYSSPQSKSIFAYLCFGKVWISLPVGIIEALSQSFM